MTYVSGLSSARNTRMWLEKNRAVRDSARRSAETAGKGLSDSVLDDPARLVDLVKATLVEAIRTDAPVGVVEELLPVLRFLSFGAASFDRSSTSAKELSALQGVREPSKIEAALAVSVANAPDDSSRALLGRMRRLAE